MLAVLEAKGSGAVSFLPAKANLVPKGSPGYKVGRPALTIRIPIEISIGNWPNSNWNSNRNLNFHIGIHSTQDRKTYFN